MPRFECRISCQVWRLRWNEVGLGFGPRERHRKSSRSVHSRRVPSRRVPSRRVPSSRVPSRRVLSKSLPSSRIHSRTVLHWRVPSSRVPPWRVPSSKVPWWRVPSWRVPSIPVKAPELSLRHASGRPPWWDTGCLHTIAISGQATVANLPLFSCVGAVAMAANGEPAYNRPRRLCLCESRATGLPIYADALESGARRTTPTATRTAMIT